MSANCGTLRISRSSRLSVARDDERSVRGGQDLFRSNLNTGLSPEVWVRVGGTAPVLGGHGLGSGQDIALPSGKQDACRAVGACENAHPT